MNKNTLIELVPHAFNFLRANKKLNLVGYKLKVNGGCTLKVIMKVNVCFVCFKTFDSSFNNEACDSSLIGKFCKFIENYLQIPTNKLRIDEGSSSFCEKCELAVINPICQIYQELLSRQLRLAWELGELGKILNNSGTNSVASDNKLRLMNAGLLARQLGIQKVADLDEFRGGLAVKCHVTGVNGQPKIMVERAILRLPPIIEFTSGDPDEPEFYGSETFSPVGTEEFSDSNDNEHGWEVKNITIDTEVIVKHEPVHGLPICEEENDIGEEEADPLFQPDSSSDSDESTIAQKPPSHQSPPKVKAKEKKTNPPCPKSKKKDLIWKNKVWHVKLPQQVNPVQNEDTNFDCPHCSVSFKTKPHLRRHIAALHNPERHACPHCVKVFTQFVYLKKHIKTSHSEFHKPVSVAHKGVDKQGNRAKKSEDEVSSWKCSGCGRFFHNEHLLKLHNRFLHNPIKCNLCKKSFNGKKWLYDHVQRDHKNGGTFPTQSFKKAVPEVEGTSELMTTNKGATGEEVCCKNCNESFSSSDHLKLHIAAIHKPECFTCPQCDRILPNKKAVDKHIYWIHTHIYPSKQRRPTENTFTNIFKLLQEKRQAAKEARVSK